MQDILGAYTNPNGQLQLLLPDVEDRIVVVAHDETSDCITLNAKHRVVTLSNREGIYNGLDVIRWDDGETWRRLQVSAEQSQLLFRRPYVPLTVLLFALVRAFVTHIGTTVFRRTKVRQT